MSSVSGKHCCHKVDIMCNICYSLHGKLIEKAMEEAKEVRQVVLINLQPDSLRSQQANVNKIN